MAWRIIQLLISIGIIIGGLSGEYVLRGTESSGALVIFGFAWLIYDIYQIVTYSKAPKNTLLEKQINKAIESSCQLTASAEIVVKNDNSEQDQYCFFFNNNEYIGSAAPGKKVSVTTDQSANAISVSYEKYDPAIAYVVVHILKGEKKEVSFSNNNFTIVEDKELLTANT